MASVPLLLTLVLSGCTVHAQVTTPHGRATATEGASTTRGATAASGGVADAEDGADVGNDRPHVTYDGLMVRRRVVIAIHPKPDTDLVSLRKELDQAASRRHTTLSSISPTVLDATTLENLFPELTVSLPPGGTLANARALIDPVSSQSRAFPEVEEFDVASVLVHDLQFTVAVTNPAAVATAVAREGILSDALGNYSTKLGRGELDIAYTGPLLSDDLIESVRVGIARRADTQPGAVIISPRSNVGVGVDMAKEPAPAKAESAIAASTVHHHGAVLSAALPAAVPDAGGSAGSSLWPLSVVGGSVLLILTLVLLTIRRFNQGVKEAPVSQVGSATATDSA